MGSLGASDSAGEARRTAAPDRHALGDERDLRSSANRLPVALFAARSSRRCVWRSSNVPTTVQNFSSCRVAGLSNGPFRGSAETAAWPKITRTSLILSRPSSHSLASNSPSGTSPGRTLFSQALREWVIIKCLIYRRRGRLDPRDKGDLYLLDLRLAFSLHRQRRHVKFEDIARR
jgi:hypothetical protein